MNGLEGEPKLGAGLSPFERGYPEPAGADALSQLGLGETSRHAGFSNERADGSGIEEFGHGRVC